MTRLIFLLCLLIPDANAQFFGGQPIGGSNGPVSRFPGPQSYRDPGTGITFYVESDGLHVAAISREGNILWVRDPFHDAKLSDYRTHKPQIVSIGPGPKAVWLKGKPHDFVDLSFNSSQFGLLRIKDGEFFFGGQN